MITKQGVRNLDAPKGHRCPWCHKENTTQKHRALHGECHQGYADYVAAKMNGELCHDR